MDEEQQRRIVEAVILASPEPIAAQRIAALIPRCNPSKVRSLVKQLNDAGLGSEVFDPCGNVPDQGDFLSVMQQNIINLKSVFAE